MPVQVGFGVNYLGSSANWVAHIAYFKAIGLYGIRPLRPNLSSPWTSMGSGGTTSIGYWRSGMVQFHQAGFFVHGGIGAVGVSPFNLGVNTWQAYHDAVVAECTYMVANNIVYDAFEIGNELEGNATTTGSLHINFLVTTLTQTAGTATATTVGAHGYLTGDTINIFGATPSGYNGSFTITVTGASTFTFTVSAGLATPATGTIYSQSLSITQLNANLRQLATDIKAISGWNALGVSLSYGCYNASANGISSYTDWIANGLGGLDLISIHPYGNLNTSTGVVSSGGYPAIASMVSAFGSKCVIGEFGVDAGNSNLLAMSDSAGVTNMTTLLNTYILPSGITNFMYFIYDNFLDTGSQWQGFAQLRNSGSMNPMWFDFFTSQPMFYTPRSASVSRGSTPSRGATVARGATPIRNLIFS